VLLAEVNYREVVGSKLRPVIVIDASCSMVLVVPCTSKPKLDALRLSDSALAGLPRATWLRTRPTILPRSAFCGRLGHVSERDFERASVLVRAGTGVLK
jgi:hypothetical protein